MRDIATPQSLIELREPTGKKLPDLMVARRRDRNSLARSGDESGQVSRSRSIRIMVVEDHPEFREALAKLIRSQPDLCLVAEVGSAEESLVAYRHCHPDVVLMNQRLPGAHGIDALTDIRREYPAARIILLSSFQSDAQITEALEAGAVAFAPKSAPHHELLRTLRAAYGTAP